MEKGRVKPRSGLNLRFKPNGDVIGVLNHNQEFTILDEVSFYRVKTRDGQVGYVHGDYIEKIPTPEVLPAAEIAEFEPKFKPIVFMHERFMGETTRVDQDFVPDLERVAGFAVECNLKVWVTSSLRAINRQVRGAIVKPAQRSCHHVGHAIDMNLFYENKLYNSKKLRKSNHENLPGEVRKFFDLIRADQKLRWGGDFRTEDPVHIDNNLYNTQELLYLAKLDSRIDMLNAT